jgi:hypothetical protein
MAKACSLVYAYFELYGNISLGIDEFDEIGVETTDLGPFGEDVFWILKRGDVRLRIGDPHPVFEQLLDRFSTLEGFDWGRFAEAQSCVENRYFLCWKRHRSKV